MRSRVLYTPPVTPWKLVIPEVAELTLKEAGAEGRINDWGEVVTREPYRKVRLDHLLSKENLRTYAVLLTHKQSLCVI